MPLWSLKLAYDGSAFHGWQTQPGLPTIQGTLATALHQLTGETILPQGAGRTDACVHALGQVCSFELKTPIPPANLLRALNRALPPAIRVLEADHAEAGFHARKSAVRKTYEYRLHPPAAGLCSPFLAPYVWDCPWPADFALLCKAALQILGEHDFTSFAASDPDQAQRALPAVQNEPNNVRTIHASTWTQQQDLLVYRVTGSGFLHHMVRNLVGTFVEIGSQRRDPDCIPAILAARDRSSAGLTAPGRGLFLVSVEYVANDHSPIERTQADRT